MPPKILPAIRGLDDRGKIIQETIGKETSEETRGLQSEIMHNVAQCEAESLTAERLES